MPSDISTIWSLLWDMYEKTKGTAWEWIVPFAVMAALCYLAVKFVCIPCGKGIKKLYDYIQKKRFASKQFYHKLSYMDPRDVYQAINRYIPTRFSRIDPSNNDEPTPEYIKTGKEQAPLLLEQFLQYEYSVKYGQKYYLCLGDCGMGKTTFLLNLYYQTSKLKQFHCVFIPLQMSDYLERIEKIENPANTILMLDALDENEKALADYKTFITELEKATADFCRIIITARTNFFENAAREQLGGNKKISSTSGKISSACKFYIMPFTDEDIKQYLKMCYPFRQRKQKQAWNILESNKNLSVRPMLLKFMDPLLKDGKQFDYDFQLYEYLFEKWIEREQGSLTEAEGKKLYEECLLVAKAIYYQWMKNGRIGIYPHELEDRNEISGLESVKLKGHALLNRTSDGMYKFSHKSYWEYLLAKLALSDVQFSNDLLIGNFDRAVGFLEEMIAYREAETEPKKPGEKVWYTRSGRLFTGYEASIGVANYLLKYKKPEDAEVIYKEILASGDCSEELRLFAMVKLAKSYWQQVKYQSAGKLLKEINNIVSEEFREGWLYIYGEFADLYASYSCELKIKAGQDFLERLIALYENWCACGIKHFINYGLLRCYENYCCCCMNYKQKYDCLDKMREVIEQNFQNDQYAEYLMLQAETWKMSYRSGRLLSILKRIQENFEPYMDAYDQLVFNCNMAEVMYTYYSKSGTFDGHRQKQAFDYLEQGLGICEFIYDNSVMDHCDNPYNFIIICHNMNLLSYTYQEGMSKLAEKIYDYMQSSGIKREINNVEARIRRILGRSESMDLTLREKNLKEALELAESTYWRACICCDLRYIYRTTKNVKESQRYLKKAYEYIVSDSDLYLSEMHSGILRLMLLSCNGSVDKKILAEKMLQILPDIYGNTKPEVYEYWDKKLDYEVLASFYKESSDKCLIDIYTGLLECNVTKEYLDALYNTCIKLKVEDQFLNIVSTTIQGMENLSKEESDCLGEFLQVHSQYLGTTVKTALCSIIKVKQKQSGGYRYDIF